MRIPVQPFLPLAFVIALIPATAVAQGQPSAAVVLPSHGDIGVGLEGGGMFASLDQGSFKWQGGSGITAGLFVDGWRGNRLGVTTEFTYDERFASNLGGHAHLHFIEVPVLARVTLVEPSRGRAGMYAVAGPAFDFNVKSTPSGGASTNFNAVDVGAIVGVGVNVRQIVVEARENVGLRPLQANTPGLTSREFVVTFGVRLR
jgi:hypothetical protein